ncbi:MAG: hypothetical protein IIB94_00920 [Candidatus Marinimicrobia bacterium]|nr:hypothetical protein [Candidatus Neomarinimicrobiota bacterium]
MSKNEYAKSVFINCPFDEDYQPLLHAILFVVIYLGFKPRISLEKFDSGEPRFQKICELIRSCQYGIHDLSRIKSRTVNEYFRFNMPFELGLDIGCKVFQPENYSDKQILILEKEKYRYQAALSDLASSDIMHHDNEPENVVRNIRNWFVTNIGVNAGSPTKIWYAYNDFLTKYHIERKSEGFSDKDIYDMPLNEFTGHIKKWVNVNTKP